VHDYLWDRSGPADPLVERLEEILKGSRLQRTDGPLGAGRHGAGSRGLASVLRPSRWMALAAVLALAIGVGAWYARRGSAPKDGWHVAAASGTPLAGGSRVGPGGVLEVGDWLVTDSRSSVTVDVPRIGSVAVAPNSKLRIKKTGEAEHLVDLAHGRISATIIAPPRIFLVQTRAALATDMGCRYDLDMPEAGPGLLTVTLGWVQLDGAGATPWVARVPRGVSCVIDPKTGPGTPFRVGASALRALLTKYDASGWSNVSDAALGAVLEACGSEDGVTVWHLLHRVSVAQRGMVLTRLGVLYTLPKDLDQSAVLNLEPAAMDRLWSRVAWD
jgi:hypothetical protein